MQPRVDRPHIPHYGIPERAEGMLGWGAVERAIGSAPRYWIATTGGDGAPHVIQQWGVWVAGALYFEGGLHTRWARNLQRDPRAAVTVERRSYAVMIEGLAEHVRAPATSLARAIIAAYRGKPYGYVPAAKNWTAGGLWAVRPRRVFAWRYAAFMITATRFRFEP